MNQKTLKFTCRVVAALLLSSIFTFAFVMTRSAASEQVASEQVDKSIPSQKTATESKRTAVEDAPEGVALKAEKRGFPLLNLQDGKKLGTKYVGANGSAQSLSAAQSQPLTMTNADLNLDGASDLVVGYAGSGGGHLALYAGNPDALSARTPETFEAIKEGRFPAPFLPEARLIALPVAPDFVGVGDFNRDGWKDIVAAQRGASSLVLLAGNARGSYKPQSIELPGGVTALLTENIDPADGQPDVAVALSDSNGAWLFVFDNQHNAFAEQPRMYPLPAEATSLALGQLDDSAPMDILAAAGGKALVIHGSYPEKNDSPESQLKTNAGQVESLSAGADVAAVRIGHFVWDRENQPEIALLSANGVIRILQRGNINQRQYTEAEWEAYWTKQEEQDQIELKRRSADPTNRATGTTKQRQARQTDQSWTETDSFQLSSQFNLSGVSPASVFTSARMTTDGIENLIIADASSNKIKVLLQNNDELKASAGESNELSATGALAAIELDSLATPMAVLPMRLGVMTRPGLVMVDKESGEVSYAVAAPLATFTVNTTTDTSDGVCDANCSLRDAIRAANTAAGADIVSVPPGTYTLTIGPADDSPADPSDQDSGDLDVRGDLTITGAGQATTIIQAGATAATGIDRVLHTRQTSVGIPDISISGVTIRHGRCSSAGSVANPNGARCNTGGAGLLHSVDDLGAVTITDSTITTNWNVATNAGTGVFFLNGAGIFIGRGDTILTNATVSNNENGATGSDNGGDGGGVLFGFSSATNINTAVLTNVTMTGNIARIIGSDTLGGNGGGLNQAYDDVDINGGNYSNNTADLDGGAFYLLTKTDLFGNASVTGNTAKRDGGGIWSDPLNTDATPATNTVANLTIRNNTADSDNAIHPQFPGDPRGAGGGIYHDRATLTLTTVTLGGTSAGQPNTSFDGGGLGHRYRAQASTSNVSTITINGSSILGNIANNDGGGIFHDATRTAGASSTISVAPSSAVTLTDNKAKNNGGGVSNSGGASATLANMLLRSNQANSDASGGGDGGALYQDTAASTTTFTGTLTIGGSGFANSAVNGAGIRNNAGTVTIPSNASITHNTATGTGGGISNAGTLSALANSTITNNTATGNGGGIHNTGTLSAITTPTLNNNSGAGGGGIFSSSNFLLSITNGSVSSNIATVSKGGGIEISGGATASVVNGVTIQNNTGSGLQISGSASVDAANNTITGNSGDGITKTSIQTGSHFNSNVIHTNGELGIDLSDNGVTPNDVNDVDTGPNNLQNFPVINWVRRGDGIGNVTLNSPNGKYRIQYYANTTCDASGHGEGEVLMTSQVVDITSGNTLTFATPSLAYGTREQITATATHDVNGNSNFDDDGNTSEFSACRKVNTLPTFGTAQTISRQQGSPASNSLIATVADPDQALNTLVVTVNGGASATVNGVTVSGIAIDASGNVTANVVASCNATNATFTLRVTDTPGEFNEQTLTVNVTPNTPPTLGTYPNTTVNAGSSGTVVTPSAAPTDNGTVATLTASAPGFTGTFVGNTTTGTVTVNSAGPAGIYTVTVTATDNCGATTTTTFQLTVNAIPTITGATISRQQGSPSANSQIATVNDADQAENTLVVTVNGGASATVTGVTVSNIAVDASGNVTADVVASCTGTNATFTLTVTDSNGASSNATLTVNVTPNTPPTVGTYPSTSVTPGGGTTVTPTAAPADNGSISSATAAAPGFTGTLAVNSTTGVVTVANANPPGTYTVTVTFTDNCGATTSPTFMLTVGNPPTITAATGIIRSQGNLAASSNSQIATVNDVDQTENTLVVTVNGGATATVNGVTVSNIAVDASGNVTANVVASATATTANFTLRVTDAQGSFTETMLTVTIVAGGFEADVAPRPNGDGNGRVNGGDVTQVQRFAVGLDRPFQSNEFQRADSAPRADTANDADTDPDLGNGAINGGDVTQAQRYSVNLDGTTPAGGPTGPPASPMNASEQITGAQTENGIAAPEADMYTVTAVRQALTATTITVAIQLDTSTGSTSAGSVSGTLRFVPTEIGTPTNVRLGSGAPAGTSFFVNTTDTANGRLGFTINAPVNQTFAVGQQQLLLIDFTIVGSGSTVLSFDDSQAQRFVGDVNGNELTPSAFPSNTVSLSPTAAMAGISGRVQNAEGVGFGGVTVTLLDTASGQTKTTVTGADGRYEFSNLPVGVEYIVTSQLARHSFSPANKVVSLLEEMTDINFIAASAKSRKRQF